MEPLFRRQFLYLSGSLILSGAALLGFTFYQRLSAHARYEAEVRLAVQSVQVARSSAVLYSETIIRPGTTFSQALSELEVDPAQAQDIILSAGTVFDLRQVRAGSEVDIGRTIEGQLQEVRYQIDGDRMLSVRPHESGFTAEIQPIPSRTETVAVDGEISDSLFGAVSQAGEGPELALRLAEIFGWDLDFYSDPRVGDTFRVQVEKKTSLDGKNRSYGRITYAEYVNDGHPYRALLFHDSDGRPAYFSPAGQSLQKAFLRSPLKFSAAVTSGFSRSRFHPILHAQRAHLGTDYGAPTGTPVQAIGSGRVVFAGYKGANGNMVQLHHSNGYDSLYLHLSRITVRAGDRVSAGDRIGLVGQTGLATGPHLHFSILDHGVYRNFEVLRRSLPSAEPVAKADLAEFSALRENVMAQMDRPSPNLRANTDPSSGSGSLLQSGQEKAAPSIRPTALR
jgi:murein DD-endopeptidase MepM/ murein hydrolase activator NlpD